MKSSPHNVRLALTLALTLAGLVLCASFVSRSLAGPRGEWTRITDTTGKNIDEVTAARTPDGSLHLLWLRKNGNNQDLVHTAIGADGRVAGAPATVLSNWAALTNPALVVAGGKLRALFGGMRSTDTKDPYSSGSLFTATSDTGATWTLEPDGHAMSHSVYASPTGATLAKDGKPVSAWAMSSALMAHVGMDPKQQDLKLETRCCTYQPGLATDSASGEVVLAWYSNVTKANGLWTQTLLPSAGEAVFVPGSADETRTNSLSSDQRVGIAARRGAPGIYVGYCQGYPTCQSVNVWAYKAAAPMVVAKAPGARFANIAAGPEGRLWVMWSQGERLYAARSNRAATHFGPIVSVAPPRGTSSVWKVGGEGSNGPLDLLASLSVESEGLATWHTQVFPPLALTASPAQVSAAQGGSVTLQVTDAGDAVAGATVKVGSQALQTDDNGRATLQLAKGSKVGTLAATASMAGYTDGAAKIVVR